ncbi:MAG: hypothetical protein IKF09_05080 [Clostridiales bacterium]|nr:hypothetical protein [Clostridiales bacterium]
MRKKGITVLIITVIYIFAAGAGLLPLFGGNLSEDIQAKNLKVNIEYLSVHMSGGYTGRTSKTIEAFSEGDKYYLVSTDDDGIKHELTRLEYLLCTDIDFDMLRNQDDIMGEDIIYESVEYRPVGGNTVSLPPKSYRYFPGMIFFFNRVLATPDYELTRADKIAIELGKYSYLHGSPDIRYISCQNLGYDGNGTYIDIYYGTGDAGKRYEFWQQCKDSIDNDAGIIADRLAKNSVDREKLDKLLEEYKKLPSASDPLYYRVQTNSKIVLVAMVDTESHTYFCTYADKARERDILRIMTGKETSRTLSVFALSVSTLLFAGAVVAVFVIPKKKQAV